MRYRKFETLASTKAMESTPAPGEYSFTSALIRALETLAESRGCFTTKELLSATMNDALHLPNYQSPVLFDRSCDSSAWRIMLSPLSAHKRIQQSRINLDHNPWEQHTITLHFDFTANPSLSVIEELWGDLNNFFSTSDRLPIRWGGVGSLPLNDFNAFHPQGIVEEGKQKCRKPPQNGGSKGGSSICSETPLSEHPHPINLARQTPEKRFPVLRGPLLLDGQGTSPEPTSFLLDPSEDSKDQRPTLRRINRRLNLRAFVNRPDPIELG